MVARVQNTFNSSSTGNNSDNARDDSLVKQIEQQNLQIQALEAELALSRSQEALAKLEDLLVSDLRQLRRSPPHQSLTRSLQEDEEENDGGVFEMYNDLRDYYREVFSDDESISSATTTTTLTAQESFNLGSGSSCTLFQQEWGRRQMVQYQDIIEFETPYICSCKKATISDKSQMTCVFTKQSISMNGLYTLSINVKGIGVTFVGLVSAYDVKQKCHEANFTSEDLMKGRMSPYMELLPGSGDRTVTINIDMTSRRAELFVTAATTSRTIGVGKQQPRTVWEQIPSNLSVAVAVKRNTERQITIWPSTYWDV